MNTQHQTVEVKELPEMTVAYVRHIGPYVGNTALFENLFGKLFKWARPRNLLEKDSKVFTVHHDPPKITKEDNQRISVSLVVPPSTEVSGDIGKMTIEGGKYAIARFVIYGNEFDGFREAWSWFYGTWFPQSGYQPDDKPFFERFVDEPKDGKRTIDLCVPVKLL